MLRSQPHGARVVGAATLWFLSLLGASARGQAAQPEPTAAISAPHLSWRAPASCPDEAAVASRLQDTLGSELASFGRDWHVRGQVRRAVDGQWQLVLELREPEQPSTAAARQRVLHARQCADLVEAAAVAVALALGDARELASSASRATSTPPVPMPPVPTPGTPSPRRDLAASDGAPLARTPLAKSVHVSLEAVLDTASISGAAVGGSLAIGATLADFTFGLHGVWLPERQERIGAGQSADFSLLAGGARLCHRLWGSRLGMKLAACAGLELGRFTAQSHGLAAAGRVQDTWLAPSVGVDLRGSVLGPLAARSRLELLAPLRRQTYRVDLVEPIHEIPALTVRWSLGFDAELALP